MKGPAIHRPQPEITTISHPPPAKKNYSEKKTLGTQSKLIREPEREWEKRERNSLVEDEKRRDKRGR